MMAKEPDRRFQTPAEVARSLAPFFKKNYAQRTVADSGSTTADAATIAAGPLKIEPAQRPVEPTAAPPAKHTPLPVAGASSHASTPETMWAGLIDFQEKENESPFAAQASGEEIAPGRPRWLWPALGAALAVAALALCAVVIPGILRSTNPAGEATVRTETEVEAPGLGAEPDFKKSAGVDVPKRSATVPDAAWGTAPLHEEHTVGNDSRAGGGTSKQPSKESAASSREEEKPVAALAKPPAPAPADVPDRSVAPAKVVSNAPAPPSGSVRWTWIHDAPLPAFDKWVEGLRKRGYRPTFVNGHDLATRVRVGDEPDVPGVVRIAAVAVKDDRHLHFEYTLDVVEKGFDRLGEMQRRGYQLDNMTTFTNGTKAYVLAIYTEYRWAVAYWWIDHTSFPEPLLSKWLGKSDRPFTLAGRPEGDFWAMVVAARDTQGVPWQIHHGLKSNQLQEVLGEATAKGFRPETLFVCPGKARGGFGVVLIKDNPSLLWEVHADLPSARLESDFAHMVAKGYALDQIVGYATSGASGYLVSWVRDPSRYPATGWCDPSLEAADEALEQFLIQRHVPWCAFAAMRSGKLLVSRGYGSMDQKTRELIAADIALPLGDVSIPLAAAAARSLIAKKKLREDATLSDVLRRSDVASGLSGNSSARRAELLKLSIGNLLDSVSQPAAKAGEQEGGQPAAGGSGDRSSQTAAAGKADRDFRGVLLARAVAAAAGKDPAHAIADEVLLPGRPAQGKPARGVSEGKDGPYSLAASAPDLARFFLRHQLDGRPLSGRVKPVPGVLSGSEKDAQTLVVRKDDLVFVLLFRLPAEARPQFTDDLRACLDRAVETSTTPHAPPAKRRSLPR